MTKVLIADDNAGNLYFLEILLKAQGFDVSTSANGAAALESALNNPPDLIVSDILMPVMDGYALCRQCKSDERLKHIPFAFYTATYTESEDQKFGLDLGADRFILKPQEPEILIRVLEQLLKEKYPAKSAIIESLGEEMEFLRRHNEVLFRKLEKKMFDLEVAYQNLKTGEEELRKEEEFLGSIVENIPDMIFVKDAGTLRFVRFNKAGEKLLGLNREDLIGKNDYDLFSKSQADFFTERDREVLKNKQLADIPEESIQTRHLGKRILHTKKIPIITRGGEAQFLLGISEDITDRKLNMERMKRVLEATVQAMAVTVETRDPYTAGHQRRVAEAAYAIAREMNLTDDQIEGVRMASLIHDLGKISVPAELLSMPRKLSVIEFSLIKNHAQSGFEILKDIDFPWPIARMVLEHHERMDGSGYPQGLVGEEILMEARILSVADVVESMASHRPYRPALGLDAALKEIENNKGTLYDADVVDACLRLFREKEFQFEGA